jgi:fructooligosaccharide transport system substrate-binding protein
MMKPRIISVFAALLLLAACSGQVKQSGASLPPGSLPPGVTTEGAVAYPGSADQPYTGTVHIDCSKLGNVTLSVLHFKDENDTNLADFHAAFPCITLQAQEIPFPDMPAKIAVMSATHSLPDIIYYDSPYSQSFAYSGILLPLDKYFTPEHLADILPAGVEESTYKGKVYAAGLRQTAIALVYNKNMTDAAGIHPPQMIEQGWTWDQALEALKKLQQGPSNNPTVWALAPTVFGDGTPGSYFREGAMMRSAGDPNAPEGSSALKTFQGISKDLKTVDGYVNSPEAIQALQFVQNMYNVAKITPKASEFGFWVNGKSAMDFIDPYIILDIKDKGDAMFPWGMTPAPFFKTHISHSGGDTIGVSATSTHPDLAAAFVMFAASPTQQHRFYDNAGALGVLQSVYAEIPDYQVYPQKLYIDELKQISYPRPPSPVFAQYQDIMSRAIHDVALGADAKQRMDAAVVEMDAVLSKFVP